MDRKFFSSFLQYRHQPFSMGYFHHDCTSWKPLVRTSGLQSLVLQPQTLWPLLTQLVLPHGHIKSVAIVFQISLQLVFCSAPLPSWCFNFCAWLNYSISTEMKWGPKEAVCFQGWWFISEPVCMSPHAGEVHTYTLRAHSFPGFAVLIIFPTSCYESTNLCSPQLFLIPWAIRRHRASACECILG